MKLSIEDKIKKLNLKSKIKIMLKKGNSKSRIYLYLNKNYKQSYLFTDQFITADDKQNDISLKIVEEIRTQKEIEIALNNLDHLPGKKSKEESSEQTTTTDFRTYYLQKIESKNPVNREHYKNALHVFMKWLKKEIDIHDITPKLIETYAKTLTHLSTHTQFGYIASLKIILNEAIKDDIIQKNPVQIKIKKEEANTVFLTIEEIQRIFNVTEKVNMQVRNAFLFSCFTGLRKSDIYALTWDQIKNEQLSVKQQKTKNFVRMKLSDSAKSILNLQDNNQKHIFDLPNYRNLRINLQKIMTKAQIEKKVNFHSARHTFGTLCVTYDIDIFTIKQLMGHTEIETTLKYAKLVDKKKDEAIDKLPKI